MERRGKVVKIRDNLGSTLIPFDHIVLSAHGSAATLLRSLIDEEDELEVSQEIRNLANNCTSDVTTQTGPKHMLVSLVTTLILSPVMSSPIQIPPKIPTYILVLRLLSMTSIFILLLWMDGSPE
jgi:hypothetical protein